MMNKDFHGSIDESAELKQNPLLQFVFAAMSFILLIYARLAPAKDFLFHQNNILWDPDSCYHARRIFYIAQHAMRLPFFDPLLAYPDGAVPIWSPLYDWISALPAFILSFGNPAYRFVLISAVIVNMVFGLLSLFVVSLLVYKSFKSLTLAILAALITGATKAHMMYTNLGILDHNSLVMFLFFSGLYFTCILLSGKDKKYHTINSVLLLLTLALLFWSWPGVYIHIAIIAVISFLYILFYKKYYLDNRFSVIYLLSAVLTVPLALMNSHFNKELLRFEFVSFLSVSFLVTLSIIFYLIASLDYLHGMKISDVRKIIKLLLPLLLLIAIACISINQLKAGIKYATAQNMWLSSIIESQPLFFYKIGSAKVLTFYKATTLLGYLLLFFLVGFFLIMLKKIKVPDELFVMLIAGSIMWGLLAFFQQKYASEFSFFYGVVTALLIEQICNRLANKLWLGIIIGMILMSVLITAYTDNETQLLDSITRANYYGLTWLKQDAQASDSAINSLLIPKEGVMAPWDLGHYIHLYSQMPAIADNFGFIYLDKIPWQGLNDMAKFFMTDDEETAIAILNKYHCSYVIVTVPSAFENFPLLINESIDSYVSHKYSISFGKIESKTEPKIKFLNTIAFRLISVYGSENVSQDDARVNFKALKHFRLVYELPGPEVTGEPVPAGNLKIYKLVKGAKLEVNAEPGQLYNLESSIITNTGNYFIYRQKGYFNHEIRVPYATEQYKNYPHAISYKLQVGNSFITFDNIPESAVQ